MKLNNVKLMIAYLCKMKSELIGKVFTTNEGYDIEIIDYKNRHNVEIKFLCDPEYITTSTTQNIKKGQIKYPYHKTVYGRGYYGVGEYTARKNNTKTPQYIRWFSMMNRCYNPKYHERQPTYVKCEVCEEWFNFQNFAKWYDENIYDCELKLELDKDLLSDSKIYSPETCCFLPKGLNINIKDFKYNKEEMMKRYHKYEKYIPKIISDKILEIAERESM